MEINEFTILMQYMASAYNVQLNEETLAVWYDFFKRYDKETFKNGILQTINQCKRYPSIAELKETIAMQTTPQVGLSGDKEWEKVLESVREYGYYQEEKALNSMEPITRDVVKRIGFKEICMADENRKYNLRSTFLKSFDNEKQELIRYKNAIKNDTEEMIAIQERNKEVLEGMMSNLIKKIDYEKI